MSALPYSGEGSPLHAGGLASLDDAELAALVCRLDEALSTLLAEPLVIPSHARAVATLHYIRGRVDGRLA